MGAARVCQSEAMISPGGVVFVHGLIGSFCEPAAIRSLADRRVSAPHLDGYGENLPATITLERQVGALRRHIEANFSSPVHLVAHSIGAVYAFSLAALHPQLVESVITAEGNFSLADAFWSSSIAALPAEEAEATLVVTLGDPERWLRDSSIESSPLMLERARDALAYQPWETVWGSARVVVETTGESAYQRMVQRIFETIPVHLLAGERSASGWAVPDWAREAAASTHILPGAGHLMMLERPELVGETIVAILDSREKSDAPSASRRLLSKGRP